MTPGSDPDRMSADERRAELAELLGKAYLRLVVARESRRKALEESPPSEAPWNAMVNAHENGEGETA